MRNKGSKNKPKTIKVKMSEIKKFFSDDAEIMIDSRYRFMFQSAIDNDEENIDAENEESTPLNFTVVEPHEDLV